MEVLTEMEEYEHLLAVKTMNSHWPTVALKVLAGPSGGEIKQVIGTGIWNLEWGHRCLQHEYGIGRSHQGRHEKSSGVKKDQEWSPQIFLSLRTEQSEGVRERGKRGSPGGRRTSRSRGRT